MTPAAGDSRASAADGVAHIVQTAQASEPMTDAAHRSSLLNLLQTGSVEDVLAHVQLLVDAERYERAAGLLHSLLIRAPDNVEVKLLLAQLYLALDVPNQAALYAEQARGADGASAEQRRRADRLVSAARTPDPRASDGLVLDGRVRAGVRYSSNANRGTSEDSVLVNGRAIATPDASEAEEDFDGFATLYGRLRAPLSERLQLDTQGFLFARKYSDLSESDVLAGRLEPGIVIDLGSRGDLSATLRPYAAVSAATAQTDLALQTGAVGVDGVQQLGSLWRFTERFEIARYNYRAGEDSPNADDQDATQASLDLRALRDLGDGLGVSARYEASVRDAAAPFNDRFRQRIGAGVSQAYPTTLLETDRPSSIGFDVTYIRTVYDEPNPAISAATARRDNEWRASASHSLPLGADAALHADATYSRRQSNLANYDRDGLDLVLSVSSRF
ncbi:tetratricopeptide repeat protein [Marivibrio sp.]|uniref:tetratricopeptide repeat protein n=1 Tax=Marivibrio sp. TaxID=2039719 RepID=UPI0032ECD7E4